MLRLSISKERKGKESRRKKDVSKYFLHQSGRTKMGKQRETYHGNTLVAGRDTRVVKIGPAVGCRVAHAGSVVSTANFSRMVRHRIQIINSWLNRAQAGRSLG